MENGLTEEKIARLADYAHDPLFSERERLALEYAEKMALDHVSLGDDFFRRLRTEFDDPEIVELGMAIGQYIGFGRLLHVLDAVQPACQLEASA